MYVEKYIILSIVLLYTICYFSEPAHVNQYQNFNLLLSYKVNRFSRSLLPVMHAKKSRNSCIQLVCSEKFSTLTYTIFY